MVIAADWRSVALSPMIDRGDIRQATTVAAISGLHCRNGAAVGSVIKYDASDGKIQRSGRTVREIDDG